ncbi:hypothetical protein, partial [Nocardia sp. NPDC058497]|uniref:hypothetical protein n=1 Tax=Nocardia sp. NPDC058497 TaxID=3346529 RepID=UPI003651410B
FPATAKPATAVGSPGYCQLWIGIDAVRPDLEKRRREIDLSDYPIELIRLTTESGGCDHAAQIGTELVRLYKLLP